MNPQYQTQPLEALTIMLQAKNVQAEVTHSLGVYTHKWLPLITADQWFSLETTTIEPLKIDFLATADFSGPIVETQHKSSSIMDLFDSAPASFYSDPSPHSLLMTSAVTPSATSLHNFEISSVGNARLYINDTILIDNCGWTTTGEAGELGTLMRAWYGGQEAGNALWDVLTGSVCPSGRLPVS